MQGDLTFSAFRKSRYDKKHGNVSVLFGQRMSKVSQTNLWLYLSQAQEMQSSSDMDKLKCER